jgi:hypothetical protein
VQLSIIDNETRNGVTQMTAYRIELEGFVNHFTTLADMKAWVAGMKAEYPRLCGKVAKVYKGVKHSENLYGFQGAPVLVPVE